MFLLTWLAKSQFRIQMESIRVARRFGSGIYRSIRAAKKFSFKLSILGDVRISGELTKTIGQMQLKWVWELTDVH